MYLSLFPSLCFCLHTQQRYTPKPLGYVCQHVCARVFLHDKFSSHSRPSVHSELTLHSYFTLHSEFTLNSMLQCFPTNSIYIHRHNVAGWVQVEKYFSNFADLD